MILSAEGEPRAFMMLLSPFMKRMAMTDLHGEGMGEDLRSPAARLAKTGGTPAKHTCEANATLPLAHQMALSRSAKGQKEHT